MLVFAGLPRNTQGHFAGASQGQLPPVTAGASSSQLQRSSQCSKPLSSPTFVLGLLGACYTVRRRSRLRHRRRKHIALLVTKSAAATAEAEPPTLPIPAAPAAPVKLEPKELPKLPTLPLLEWLKQVNLHASLDDDARARYWDVPQQADSAIAETVGRIQEGARKCIAPSASAHPFGSTVNGFGEASSDLDVLIAVHEEELRYYMSYVSWYQQEQRFEDSLRRQGEAPPGVPQPQWPQPNRIPSKMANACAVNQLADFLPELGFRVLRALPNARKPLVTLEDRSGALGECDVSINNRLPLSNTILLRSYAKLDPRVRPLVLFVKAWAKGKRICSAGDGNLSSYSWTIMVIYFLQLVGVVPCLQLLAEVETFVQDYDYWGKYNKFNASFLPAEDYLAKVKEGTLKGPDQKVQDLTLAELIYGFFRFFSQEYQWGLEVISMRCPERRAIDSWFKLYGKVQPEPAIHVEDPIELRDLNIVMRRERLAPLKVELQTACKMLESGSSFQEIMSCSPQLVLESFTPSRNVRSIPALAKQRRDNLRALRPKPPRHM